MSLLTKSCNFCDRTVPKGTGTMLALNNGTVLWFCSSKCKKKHDGSKKRPKKAQMDKEIRKRRN